VIFGRDKPFHRLFTFCVFRPVNSSYETSNAITKETAQEFSVYQEIHEPKVNQSTANCSTYATIKSAVESNEESQANNIVYAELDLCQ